MEPKQSKENALFEWYDSLVFALAVIVLFFVFAVRIITVSGVSMQPTLYGGDRVAVQSMLYTPQRGDVVVVDGYINYGDPLVKRIIALGGDVEARATGFMLADKYSAPGIKVTVLAQGLPAGANLTYADSATINAALSHRRNIGE